MVKRFLIAALLAAIVAGGTGCMFNHQQSGQVTKPSANDLALAYMEEKYGEVFTFSAPWGNSLTGTREILVTCDSLPGEQILVQVENFKEENKIFRDNYLAVKYREETMEFFRSCASGYYSDINIHYEVHRDGQSPELTAQASFEDYMTDSRTDLVVMLELRRSEFTGTEPMEKIAEKITELCSSARVTVVVVEDDVFGTMDTSALNKCISKGMYVARAKVYIRNGSVEIDWRGEGIGNG